MMNKYAQIFTLVLLFVFSTAKGQNQTGTNKSESKEVISSQGPKVVTRNIIQDRKGNIWIAAFDGIFRYDGKAFTNIVSKVSSARFFSLLEDRKGNFWFGSIGSGIYYYDGKTFRNFTTKQGLAGYEVTSIYEDKTGTVWFGAHGGVSRYDGKTFRNYRMKGDSIMEDKTEKSLANSTRSPNEVTSIIEDKTGKFWFGTRGNTFVYDGKTFTKVTHQDGPFTNVRTIIEDKKGNIWLGGPDGLWRYDGRTFTNLTDNFVGYVYEDKKGNIWTSSKSPTDGSWVLSRYDEKFLSTSLLVKPTATEINPKKGMLFGILEDDKGNIWFGADGVYRYDGNTITDFKEKGGQK